MHNVKILLRKYVFANLNFSPSRVYCLDFYSKLLKSCKVGSLVTIKLPNLFKIQFVYSYTRSFWF
jgi:hypothetical protein